MHLTLHRPHRPEPLRLEALGGDRFGLAGPPAPPPRPARWVGALLLGFLVALPAAGYACRTDIVRLVPATARLYAAVRLPVNLRGLSLDAVRSVEEIEQGEPILVVSGTITNITEAPVDLPRLRLAVRGTEPTEIYAWTARATESRLMPGQSIGFRARLAAPPEAGRSVAVRFEDAPKTRLGLR